MAKQFQTSGDARNLLMEGIDILSKAVGITLGPRGRNVILGQDFGPPQVCSDGVTIAKEIELEEPFQNMGAQLLKEAASKTNDSVGDGTTTSTILAQSMLSEGFKNLAAGADPMALKRGIEKAVQAIRVEIKAMARPVAGKEEITRVAVLASHDEEMGGLIGDVMDKIGADGVVTVEESKGLGFEIEYVEGMQIDRGYISPHFVTDLERMHTELDDPYILITTEKISSMSELLPMLEKLTPLSKTLVVIAEDVDGEALATLVVNKLRGTLSCVAIKAPGFGERRKAILDDLGILLGATVVTKDVGLSLDKVTVENLGRCRRVVVTKDDTTFIEGAGDHGDIESRIKQIRLQVENTTSDYDKEKLEERAAKLGGGVSVIKVGAPTEVELREKKQRLQDALSAVRAAMDEGIVAGGGTTLVRAVQATRGRIEAKGDEIIGVEIVASAVDGPIKLIASNAGLAGDVILDGVKNGEGDWGFDAEKEQFGKMLEMGIMDPAKVTRSALENAASVAGMVLTTEALITEAIPMPEPEPSDPSLRR
jgi:chaperonin GroEL